MTYIIYTSTSHYLPMSLRAKIPLLKSFVASTLKYALASCNESVDRPKVNVVNKNIVLARMFGRFSTPVHMSTTNFAHFLERPIIFTRYIVLIKLQPHKGIRCVRVLRRCYTYHSSHVIASIASYHRVESGVNTNHLLLQLYHALTTPL